MVENTLPRAPAEHWEKERADWILAVSQLVDEIEQWAVRRGWWVHREPKAITADEDRIGTYDVPMLRIQTPTARLIVEPIARYIVGAEGRVDLAVFPSYHTVPIVRRETGWRIEPSGPGARPHPWSEESLIGAATTLAAKA